MLEMESFTTGKGPGERGQTWSSVDNSPRTEMTSGFWDIDDKHSIFPWSQASVLFVGMVLVSFTERTEVRS